MSEQDKKFSLSIFLIKEAYSDVRKCTRNTKGCGHYEIKISGVENAHLFLGKSTPHPPDWHRIFPDVENWKKFQIQTVKGLLLIQSKRGRWFALTFGYGKSFLDPFAFEENFGFKTVINSIDPEALKTIDKKSIIENPLLAKEQITKNTDLSQFNVDAYTDFLSRMKGRSKVEEFGANLDGRDSLRISVEVDLKDIPDLLDTCLSYYKAKNYKAYFPEIDNVVDVRDKELLKQLETTLLEYINNENYDLVWASIPDFYDEEHFECFHYSTDRSELRYYDIELKDYLRTKKDKARRSFKRPITKDILQRDQIIMRNKNNVKEPLWKMWRCIYTEIQKGGSQYIFYDGDWYLVGQNYIDEINARFTSVGRDDPGFPSWQDSIPEGNYLRGLNVVKNGEYCVMDSKTVNHDGRSKIEFCDLLTKNNELIHVKKYGGSSVLSHLFKQGEVSASLFLDDAEFRHKVEAKIDGDFTIEPNETPEANKYTIWFVIGTKYFEDPNLPLFSRIAFVNTLRLLKRYRFNVRIGYIKVEKLVQAK